MLKAFLPGILFVLLLGHSPASAQINIVPKTGITLGTYSLETHSAGDLYQEKKGLNLGLTAGVGVNIPLDQGAIYCLQPEILLSNKAIPLFTPGKWLNTSISTIIPGLRILQLPVLLQMHHRREKWDLYALMGPSLGYALYGKQKFRGAYQGQEYSSTVELKFSEQPDDNLYDKVIYLDSERANRWDVAAQFGLGAGLPFGPGELQLEARFGLGLVSLYKDMPFTPQKEQPEGKSRTLVLAANYAISLGKNNSSSKI